MAGDNVTDGSGNIFATDAAPGTTVHYPIEKLAFGAPDTFTLTEDTNAKRFPVKVGSGLEATSVVAGQIQVGTTEVQFPNVSARRFRVKALIGNDGPVYLGPTGLTGVTGYPLEAGDVTPPLELSNLNVLFALASTSMGGVSRGLGYLGEV